MFLTQSTAYSILHHLLHIKQTYLSLKALNLLLRPGDHSFTFTFSSDQPGVSQYGDHRPPQLPQGAPRPAIAHVAVSHAVSAWVTHTVTLRWSATTQRRRSGTNYLVTLNALIESFQNQVSLLDLEQVVKNAVDWYLFTERRFPSTTYIKNIFRLSCAACVRSAQVTTRTNDRNWSAFQFRA